MLRRALMGEKRLAIVILLHREARWIVLTSDPDERVPREFAHGASPPGISKYTVSIPSVLH
jgi:hypothetical protein